MIPLALAALLWLGLHVGVAGSGLRGAIVARAGETGFRAAFSVASVVAITLLVAAYNAAPVLPLWSPPAWAYYVLAVCMLAALLLFAASVLIRSPTAIGGEAALRAEPRGILRVTRHPMLWSFAIWAAVHAIGAGDAASVVFFGAFGVTALAGMPSIDAKLAARDPDGFAQLAARTSIAPLAAVLGGRTAFRVGEIGVAAPALGAALFALLLAAHPYVIGVSPLPR